MQTQNGSTKRISKLYDRSFLLLIFFVFIAGMLVSWLQSQIFVQQYGLTSKELNNALSSLSQGMQKSVQMHTQTLSQQQEQDKQSSVDKLDPYGVHIIITSSGNAYQNVQMRVQYASYKKVQKLEGGEYMVGFTRILHNGPENDPIVDEVPTHRVTVTPNPDYIPGERCQALQRFAKHALDDPRLLQGAWVHIGEPDVLWIRPLPLRLSALGGHDGYTQEFLYVKPKEKDVRKAIEAVIPTKIMNVDDMQPVGPFPTTMRIRDLYKLATKWFAYEQLVDKQNYKGSLKEKSGWIREMYTFMIAANMVGLRFHAFEMFSEAIMTQLPGDRFYTNRSSYFHYTWAIQIKEFQNAPNPLWQFEKRDWLDTDDVVYKVPIIQKPPPYNDSWYDTWDLPFEIPLYNATVFFVNAFNEVAKTLPIIPKP